MSGVEEAWIAYRDAWNGSSTALRKRDFVAGWNAAMPSPETVDSYLNGRLRAAEDVATTYGWCPVSEPVHNREKALNQLWRIWYGFRGAPSSPADSPHLTDRYFDELAVLYDRNRETIRAALAQVIEFVPRGSDG